MSLRNELIYINDGTAVPSPYALTIKEFKELQEMKGIELSQTDLFLTYNKYITHAKKFNKAYGDIENV